MQPVMETILHRRSIRRFAPEQIREETLAQILQAGLYAPSAGGRQGVLFAVCQDRAVNTRLGKIKRANAKPRMAKNGNYVSREQPSIADDPHLTDAFYGAPTVVTCFAPKGFLFAAEDCAMAAENLMLAAHALGIGSCWIHRAKEEFESEEGKELLKSLGITGEYEGIGHCILGYVDGEYPEAAERKDSWVYWVE